jgi:tetratricopeptide (TPR) repeat protein
MFRVVSFLTALFLAAPVFSATPTTFEEIARQAEQAQNSDRLQEAVRLYQQGLRLKPTWSEGWWALGTVLYDQDRFPESKTVFQKFVTVSPKPGPGYAFLGLCEYETADYDRSLRHFRMWADKGWSGTSELIDVATFHFALLLTRDGKFIEALYLLAGEAEKSHTGPSLIEAMGLASMRLRELPETYSPEQREKVWLAGKAAFYAALHPPQYDRADEFANRLESHYNEAPNVHYFVGTLRKFEDKNQDAVEEFQHEIRISPKHASAMIELARLKSIGNETSEALALAKTASQLEPQNSEAHHVYGEILLKSGQFEASAQELEIAKRLAPDSAPVRFQLAAAYRKLHRSREAERETVAFNLLKDKQQVIASPSEKLASHPELLK